MRTDSFIRIDEARRLDGTDAVGRHSSLRCADHVDLGATAVRLAHLAVALHMAEAKRMSAARGESTP